MGEFSFQAPDTGDAVYKLTYTADMDGFQAMGDHLPVPVIMDPVPEAALPEMVDYTPEVAAARAEFLRARGDPHPRQRAARHHLPPPGRRLPCLLQQPLPHLPSASGESSDRKPAGLQLSHL